MKNIRGEEIDTQNDDLIAGINNWLAEHPNNNMVDIKYSVQSVKYDYTYHYTLIVYKERKYERN